MVFSIAIKVVRTQYHDLSVFGFVGYSLRLTNPLRLCG